MYNTVQEVDNIFEGMVLGVSRKARGMGLGKEMAQMSIAIARELHCEAYFVCVSGIYSQKIYRDMNFTVMKEVSYDDIKDRKGRTILNDTREHTKAQNIYMRL